MRAANVIISQKAVGKRRAALRAGGDVPHKIRACGIVARELINAEVHAWVLRL